MEKEASKTPRTDAAITKGCGLMVRPAFAQALELELNAANALNQELVLEIGRLKEKLTTAFNKKVAQ